MASRVRPEVETGNRHLPSRSTRFQGVRPGRRETQLTLSTGIDCVWGQKDTPPAVIVLLQ